MPDADALIRTKLRLPITRQGLVARPRLLERLAHAMRGPLALVTAPAGFGKTTLVASGLAESGMPVAWLSLDENDSQVGRFLTYLVAALQTADPAIGAEAAQVMATTEEAPPEAILVGLINDLDGARQHIALVLDDYQFISSQAVHDAVAFLLAHHPQALHMVVVTRSDPLLPLARLRARGQMTELRAADLIFTEDEAAQFLNDLMGLALSPDQVAALDRRVEGWVCGLQMAALSMRGREDVDGFIKAFAGTHRFVMDFMLEEVLAREPEEVQAFLLQTSILTRLTGPLCDAVTGASGSQAMLERLEQRNLFVVPLDDDRCWYRYHHLFADLLQARLRETGPDLVAALLLRASEWCEREGQVVEAVGYAFASGDHRHIVDLVSRYWPLMTSQGRIEVVWSWLDALPKDVVRASASLSTACCWVLWMKGEVGAIEPHLADAERAYAGAGGSQATDEESAADATLPAELAALRSFVTRYRGDYEAATVQAERALDLLPGDLPPQLDALLRALMLLALASAYDATGDLEEAASAYAESIRQSRICGSATGVTLTYRLIGVLRLLGRLRAADVACQDALAYVQTHGLARLPAAGILHVAMSTVLVEQNKLEAAEAHLTEGFELGKWSGRLDAVKNAAGALSRLRQARNDVAGALEAIEAAESALGPLRPPLAAAELLALRAKVLLRHGAIDQAARQAGEAVRLAGRDRGQTGEVVAVTMTGVQAAQSDPSAVVTLLTSSLAAAERRNHWGVALELRILRSLVYARKGSTREAQADVERALTLADPEGYVRVFLDEGQPMRNLLAQWLAHASAGPLRDYAMRLLEQFAAEPPAIAPVSRAGSRPDTMVTPDGLQPPAIEVEQPVLVEPLSQREMEVLHLLALGMTNREIAQQLFVAAGTVKAHTASIYRKLDVANRTAAVARARQLGILP